MSRLLAGFAIVGAAVAVFACSQTEAEGCAAVGRKGGPYIRIAEESAIIVWDPVKKIEHFIRSAQFDTRSPDFGFLVPTPAQPTLAEVEHGIFFAASRWIMPRVVTKDRISFDPLLNHLSCVKSERFMKDAKAPAAGVRVLEEKKIGGFQAAVLEADTTEPLANWLKDNGYSDDPELQSWLFPYVANKWKITAFKILQDPKTGRGVATKPVRMSFAAERPFFPYREPEEKKPKPRKAHGESTKPEVRKTEIDGIWRVESVAGGGKELAEFIGTTIWFGRGVAVGRFGKDVPFVVDEAKEPRWLDILSMDKGIYKLEGDTLYWCRSRSTRPKRFDPDDGVLITMRRGTEAEAEKVNAGVSARELEQRQSSGRLLRVFFVSDTRAVGKLGDGAWQTTVPWSDQLTDEQRSQLAKETGVPENEIPATAWMTTFEDRASPRPGKDEVYFEPSPDRSPIRPPDIIRYVDSMWIPIDVVIVGALFLILVVGAIVGRRLTRRTA